jgi:hypothetical protein
MIGRATLALTLLLACDSAAVAPLDAGAASDASTLSDATTVADAPCATDTDPNNCGACGHSCLGRACNAGLCTPEELFRLTYPSGCITVHDNRVYLAHGSTIERYDLDGRGRVALSPFFEGCEALAVHKDKLYFAKWGGDGEKVFRMNLDGSELATLFHGENILDAPRKMVFTEQNLLLSTRKRIWSIDLQSGAKRLVHEESSANVGISAATSYHAGFVYLAPNGTSDRLVVRVPLAGGSTEPVSRVTQSTFRNAEVAGDTAYIATVNRLFSFSLLAPNLVARTLASDLGPGQNVGLEVRGNDVYFAASGTSGFADGTIYRINATTGEVLTLARGDMNYTNIALDGAYVYFVQNTPRPRVVRVPR